MDDIRLLDGAEDIAGFDDIACLRRGYELPFFLVREARGRDAALDEVSHLFDEHLERPLDPIIDTGQQPGPELDSERQTGVLHRFAGPDACGILVDLDDDILTLDLDDLPHQFLMADLHHIIHVCVETDGSDNRP